MSALVKIEGSDWLRRLNDNFSTVGERGTHTVTGDEATANAAAIATGAASATAFIVQVFRAGVDVHADAAITLVTGTLTVADGGATYSVTAGDVINWIVF